MLDTSVAVKFYVPEEGHKQARELLTVVENGAAKLLAPSTIGAEHWNALWQKYRRGELEKEMVRETWEKFNDAPVSLFDPDSLMPAAVEVAYETEVIVYDALFLALAAGFQTSVVTADERTVLNRIRGTAHERLAVHLSESERCCPNWSKTAQRRVRLREASKRDQKGGRFKMANHKYRVEIAYGERDEGFIVRVPELDRSAFGESVEEAAHEVQNSIEAHLQALRKLGRPIPEPRVVTSA